MKRFQLVCLFLLGALLLTAVSCSSGNVSSTPEPARDAERFSVSTEPGVGTFDAQMDVAETADGAVVTLKADDAAGLSAAYVNLEYNAAQYTPVKVEFTDFLGHSDQVITLALTDVAGVVPVGLAQVAGTAAIPASGDGALATVTFAARPFSGSRAASKAPGGPKNGVEDLAIINQSGSEVTLQWTEKNVGDYDVNGLVTISDMTPIGTFFNQSVNATSDPVYAAIVDGDSNGLINVADLTPIGANFGNQITGYTLYSNSAGDAKVTDVPRPTNLTPKRSPVYTHVATVSGGETFTVRPTGATTAETGTLSNTATLQTEPGNPAAPTALTATGDAVVGAGKVQLSWTLSTSIDVANYELERKLSSEDDTAWAKIYEPAKNQNSYTDSGLGDLDYDYRLRAKDNEPVALFSDYTATATAHPFQLVMPVPLNPGASPSGSEPAGIDISWQAPSGTPAELALIDRYVVWRKGPADSDFAEVHSTFNEAITSYTDKNLTEGQTYEYKVTSFNIAGSQHSAASTTVSSQPSAAVSLAISGLTTDKTTHHVGGAEPASNITVATNVTPDSYNWTSSLGTVTGSGASVTWKPTGSPAAQVVTISCEVVKGSQTDSAEIKLYLTSETIKTTYAMGGGGDSGNIGSGGKFVDFERPSIQQPTAPYKSMSSWFDGSHVVLYNLWEIWCPPCRGEMPEMHEWAEHFEADGYVHIGHSSTYSLQNVDDWINTNGMDPDPPTDTRPWTKFYCYNQSDAGTGGQWTGDMPLWGQYWSGYGNPSMSLPRTQLYDRDGNCRLWSSTIGGSLVQDYIDTIMELTGATTAP